MTARTTIAALSMKYLGWAETLLLLAFFGLFI